MMPTRFILLLMLLATGSFLFGRCSKKENTTQSAPVDTTFAQTLEPPVGISGDTGPAAKSRQTGSRAGWHYEKTMDKAGAPVYKASLMAANQLKFEYPYVGGSMATLTIRQGGAGPQVYIEVTNGQFNRSFQQGSASVRVDAKPASNFTLSAAANGRANIVFFDAADRLIKLIKAARRLRVQVEFAGQPTRTIEFNTEGLQLNP